MSIQRRRAPQSDILIDKMETYITKPINSVPYVLLFDNPFSFHFEGLVNFGAYRFNIDFG